MNTIGGRPKALSPADLETARAAIAAGEDMHVVTRRVGLSRQTLYAAGLRKHPPISVLVPFAKNDKYMWHRSSTNSLREHVNEIIGIDDAELTARADYVLSLILSAYNDDDFTEL
jgi:Helix-turn-helix domain of resolvase